MLVTTGKTSSNNAWEKVMGKTHMYFYQEHHMDRKYEMMIKFQMMGPSDWMALIWLMQKS